MKNEIIICCILWKWLFPYLDWTALTLLLENFTDSVGRKPTYENLNIKFEHLGLDLT